MATKEVKVCDVFGGTRDVETYTIEFGERDADGKLCQDVDLCPRAVKRLKVFLDRGCTPPPSRERRALEPTNVPGQEVMGCVEKDCPGRLPSCGEVKSNG